MIFSFKDQRPNEWNHWAEVVWKNIDEPRFIGDMPHTWVGSDYINAVRAMFVYENDFDSTLILGAGLKEEWIDSPEGVTVTKMPTYYGDISYTMKKSQNEYQINLSGNIEVPKDKIIFKNFKKSIPSKVLVDGAISNNYNVNEIIINKIPSSILITY